MSSEGGGYGKIHECEKERQQKGQAIHEGEAAGQTRQEELVGGPLHVNESVKRSAQDGPVGIRAEAPASPPRLTRTTLEIPPRTC